MLQNIRDKAQGWIAWAIVILISIPFALWGIQEYMGVGSEPVVASVNGEEITERALDQRYHRFRDELRAQLGEAYRPELLDDKRVRREVLKRMVSENVVLQASHDMGLRVGNTLVRQAIMEIEAFQQDGRFDQATFERYARMQGLSSGGFEERIRQALLAEQLSQAVQSSAFITEREMQEFMRLRNQTRDLTYFTVSVSDYQTNEAPSDEEIQTYYEQHKERYRTPEQVKLEYILLNGEMAGKTVEVTEEALREYYENHLESYGQPEQRRVSHLLIRLDEDADQASVDAANRRIDELRERIMQGEDFAELTRTHSEDPGSAEEGGDLGFFGKGIMDPAFEAAAFSLQEGELSEPVRSSFGLHLIKLTGIKPGSVKPFEEVEAEVEAAYRKLEGERLYFEMAEELADLSYEEPGSLTPAASALGLQIQTSEWISRDRASGVLQSPKVLAAAFREDVLIERNNSELIELDREESIVLRVIEHKESAIQPLDEVKEQVVASLKREQAIERARSEAEKRVASLQQGEDFAEAAEEYSFKRKTSLTRNDVSVPPALLKEVFRLPHPQQDEPLNGMLQLASGDFAVYSLHGVKDGSSEDLEGPIKQQLKTTLRRQEGRVLYDRLVADLEQRADIEYLMKDED